MKHADYINAEIDLDQYLADLADIRLNCWRQGPVEGVRALARIVERLARDLDSLLAPTPD